MSAPLFLQARELAGSSLLYKLLGTQKKQGARGPHLPCPESESARRMRLRRIITYPVVTWGERKDLSKVRTIRMYIQFGSNRVGVILGFSIQ